MELLEIQIKLIKNSKKNRRCGMSSGIILFYFGEIRTQAFSTKMIKFI